MAELACVATLCLRHPGRGLFHHLFALVLGLQLGHSCGLCHVRACTTFCIDLGLQLGHSCGLCHARALHQFLHLRLVSNLDIPAEWATFGLSASPFSLPLSSEHSSECETVNNLFFWLGELSRSSTRAPTTSLPRPLARWRRMKRDQVPGTRYRHGAGIPWSGVDSKRR